MSKPKSLTRRQRALIEDLFADDANEPQVLARYKVSRKLYARWLADERFQEAIEKRIAQTHLAGRIILARAAPEAATKLTTLAASGEGEPARKACLDILAAQGPIAPGTAAASPPPASSQAVPPLPPETASRILAILAEEQDAPD
jgi:hypothetical protein